MKLLNYKSTEINSNFKIQLFFIGVDDLSFIANYYSTCAKYFVPKVDRF